ncbi:biotin carboxylase [Streptomyces sp. Amel2xB2]|uniref:ATP-grasp domain-containing protein n=1 Tax=Streptomyces sp. Amel2xB2 TaxID=1305829 RepID=UPI000DBAD8B9|nr:ATP-grasp domain-containing protein [Streptomyces sp. Amel2xB2]RAJ60483.1 biotin carboxylase [Streptomyces sp. Amel2xB2]
MKPLHHLAVFGDLFDLPARARALLGEDVHITAFVQRSRMAGCDGIEHARAVVALADDATAQEWSRAVHAVHATRPFTHAAALVDHLACEAAAAFEGTGVHFHRPETVGMVRDKRSMREELDRRGLYPVPHRLVHDADAARTAVRELGVPCVAKPVVGTGSAGAVVVRAEEEAEAAYREASADGSGVLLEHFVSGPQYSVEGFSEDGEHVVLAVTRKYSDPRTLVELGHVLPAPLPDEDREAVERCAVSVLDAVGLQFGPSHTEVVLGPDGPMPIETHARVGGDDIWLMAHEATGVDLDVVQPDQILGARVLEDVRATLAGERPERPYRAVWFGGARTEGKFAGLTVPASVRDDEHVAVTALRKEGDPVRPLSSSDDRVFKVRASGTSAQEALEAARSAAAAVAAASDLDTALTDLGATL